VVGGPGEAGACDARALRRHLVVDSRDYADVEYSNEYKGGGRHVKTARPS
jgi:hypothetical protein